MYYNQELGLCIEFGPVRDDSVRPPWIKSSLRRSRRHGLLPGLLVIARAKQLEWFMSPEVQALFCVLRTKDTLGGFKLGSF